MRNLAKSVCSVALALVMLLGLAACNSGGPKTIDAETAVKEIQEMFQGMGQHDAYSLNVAVKLGGKAEDIQKVADAISEANDEPSGDAKEAEVEPAGILPGEPDPNQTVHTETMAVVDFSAETIPAVLDILGLKLEPGTLASVALAYDGSVSDARKAKFNVSLGKADIELIGTKDMLYLGLDGVRDIVDAIGAMGGENSSIQDTKDMLDAIKNIKYLAIEQEEDTLSSFELPKVMDMADTKAELTDKQKEQLKTVTATKEGEGDNVTYVFTPNEKATGEALKELELDEALKDYDVKFDCTVARAGDTYTISVKGGTEEAYLALDLTLSFDNVNIRLPEASETITQEEAAKQFAFKDAELPPVPGEDEPEPSPLPDEPIVGGPIRLTSPDWWLSFTEPTSIDWDSFEQMDGTESYGTVNATFRHEATDVAANFQAMEGFYEADTATRQAIMERYAEQIFESLKSKDIDLDYKDDEGNIKVSLDDENNFAQCIGYNADADQSIQYDVWVSDDGDFGPNQEISIQYSCPVADFDAKAVSAAIRGCVGIDVSTEDVEMAVQLAYTKLTENKGSYFSVLIQDDDLNDTLTVGVFNEEGGDQSTIVVHMSTTIQAYTY